ncbi:MAG TPA: ATP-binding protein [Acidimicrobiia bacterium]|nr:ATP-binding protein [Acidimicrobiia bacterium]
MALLRRRSRIPKSVPGGEAPVRAATADVAGDPHEVATVHTEFSLPSAEGNEREVMERVAAAVASLGLSPARLERLKTAVAEAAMNAIEHGNGGNAALPVGVRVESTSRMVTVRITDQGGGTPIPRVEIPDIEAKLAGEQKPRGWGLFLIAKMVDEMRTHTDGSHHVIELVMNRGESW